MPKRSSARRARDDYEDDFEDTPKRRSLLRRALGILLPRRVSDTIALAIATAASLAVVVNAVAFQQPAEPTTLESLISRDNDPAAPNPQRRPADAPARSMNDLIQNIQRELSVRGFYNGAVDGVPGPRTEQAIRDFQKDKGGQNTLEPNDALLNMIRKTPVKSDVTGSITTPAENEGKSLRVLSLQRALARLGYGPIRLSGTFSPDTKDAIERFERDWRMPVTGLMSENLFTKVAAVNGSPID